MIEYLFDSRKGDTTGALGQRARISANLSGLWVFEVRAAKVGPGWVMARLSDCSAE
ncbi:hypothetical protein [Embleya sp. NPDC020630]|uniref:hypothetical protein n=1 Tax=Embleya sp. NPDC020630 TaxID=3363979 RepID=UPI00379029E5